MWGEREAPRRRERPAARVDGPRSPPSSRVVDQVATGALRGLDRMAVTETGVVAVTVGTTLHET